MYKGGILVGLSLVLERQSSGTVKGQNTEGQTVGRRQLGGFCIVWVRDRGLKQDWGNGREEAVMKVWGGISTGLVTDCRCTC